MSHTQHSTSTLLFYPDDPADGRLRLPSGKSLLPESETDGPERWLPVDGWPDYDISNWGRVRSWARIGPRSGRSAIPHSRKPRKAGKGYLQVEYRSKKIYEYVHRLVLFAFKGPCPDGQECRHKNGVRTDNRLSNLDWGTSRQNQEDKIAHGTMKPYIEPTRDFLWECIDNFIPVEAIIPREIWRDISGFPKYQASNWGRVRSRCISKKRGFGDPWYVLSPGIGKHGYNRIYLINDEGRLLREIPRLVIEAFSPRCDPSLECRHINGDPLDNHITNLRWGTHQENMDDMVLHGRSNRGTRCPTAKLDEGRVRAIRHRAADGEMSARLAEEFGVSQQAICHILKRRNWRHVI